MDVESIVTMLACIQVCLTLITRKLIDLKITILTFTCVNGLERLLYYRGMVFGVSRTKMMVFYQMDPYLLGKNN